MRFRPSTALVAAAAAVPFVLALAPAAGAEEGGRPDLVVSQLSGDGFEPGQVRAQSVTITNNGTAPAENVAFRVRLTRGLAYAEHAAGCSYATVGDQLGEALCTLDTAIEPGKSVTVPVRVKVLGKALMEVVQYGTSPTGAVPGEGYDESYRQLTLMADNTADLAAVGDTVEGEPGDTVNVTAALRNNGPGWVQNNESDDQPALMVRIPKGTTAVQVPRECLPFGIDGPTGPSEPGKPVYVCVPSDQTLDVGSVHSYAFALKIQKGAHDTSGEVKATSVYDIKPDFDHTPANDKARLTVDVPGGDASEDGGSTTPSGSGTSGSGTGTGTGTGTGAGTGTGVQAQSAAAPVLAETGVGAGGSPLLAAAAVSLAALGGFLVRGRRRTGARAS
ncbi:hypothetical protein [Streptomyces sp. NPDC088725]|uniref:hypothetical protein n=1 Tax=Streptomyces sp. NPDC088725 TaxID=3365873 RepID=UPI00380AF54B